MAILQLGENEGFFIVNGSLFPKGKFYINKSGPRAYIIAVDNLGLQISGHFSEWIGVDEETFNDVDEVGDYLSGLIGGSAGGTNVVLTQAEYDALTPPDPNTTYDIIEE